MKYISSIKKNYVKNINGILKADEIDIQCGTKRVNLNIKFVVQTVVKSISTSLNFMHQLFSTKTIYQKCHKKSIPLEFRIGDIHG